MTMTPARQVAVVGASSGLGAALATVHARRGDTVIAVARREERLRQLHSELLPRAAAGSWVPMRADLRDTGDVAALADRLSASQLDRLYLSAGANQPDVTGGLAERLHVIEPYFRLIFCAYIGLTEELIERKALSQASRVVAISSLAAAVPFPQLELYSAGKAALEAWCRGARGPGRPGFTIVRPGLFKSEFFRPSETLRHGDIPLQKAARIVQLADQGRDFVDVGGWRDVAVSRLSSLIGPSARRILPIADFDGSSVLDAVRPRNGRAP